MSKGLVAGLFLCILVLLLAGVLFVRSCQDAYWSSPAVVVPITFLGTLSSLLGGLLERFLFIGSVAVAVVGVFLGISALGLALAVSGTGYWEHPPYDQEGDYVIMRFQIDLFRFASLPQSAGGLMLGAALQMRKGQ